MNNKCKGLLGLLFGHHYESRHSEKYEIKENTKHPVPRNTLHAITSWTEYKGEMEKYHTNLLTQYIYEIDICRRCGHVIRKI